MNILLVSSEYPPESPGGLGNAVRNLALGLRACGAAPHILSSHGAAGENGRVVEESDAGIPVIRIPYVSKRWRRAPGWFWRVHPWYTPIDCYRFSRHAAEACREIIRRASIDVVQFADYRGEGYSFIGGAHAVPTVVRLATPRYLVEAINREAGYAPDGRVAVRTAGAQRMMKLLELKPIREARAIVSPSKSLARLIQRETFPKGMLRIIPTGIDLQHFHARAPEDTSELRVNLGLGETRYILFAGRYEYRKGVHDLIEAFARIEKMVPGHRLVCAGADTDTAPHRGSMKEYCARRVSELGIGSRVLLLDRVPHHDLPRLYSSASLFVAPSRYENLANTVLEAMACGVPVVSTTSGGAPEVIADPENGALVPPARPQLLADAILGLLEDPDRCTITREANSEKARLEFSRETMARRFLDLYRSIVA